jgi:hypothetical protein
MMTLTQADPTAEIACTLPVEEAVGRLAALQTLIGGRLDDASSAAGHLRIRIRRGRDADLEAKAAAWAEAEKECCAFLGFAVESQPESVTLVIVAPAGAGAVLEGIKWIVRAAGRRA